MPDTAREPREWLGFVCKRGHLRTFIEGVVVEVGAVRCLDPECDDLPEPMVPVQVVEKDAHRAQVVREEVAALREQADLYVRGSVSRAAMLAVIDFILRREAER